MYMGTGKTLACLFTILRIWKSKDRPISVLVICPKHVISVWPREIGKHINQQNVDICAQALISADLSVLETFDGTLHDVNVLVTNFECARINWKWLREVKWDCIAIDESHRMKKPTGKTSKNIWKLGDGVEYKFILTGTPTGGKEIELFGQVRFLSEKILGYMTWQDFKTSWCIGTGWKGKVLKMRKVKEKPFYDKIAEYCYVMTKSQVPNRKEGVNNYLYFDMTGKAKKKYRELEKTFYTTYKDEEFWTPLAITNMLRLQQLTGGFLDNGEVRFKMNQDKMNALKEWFKDFPEDEKLVIAAKFTAEIDELYKFFSKYGSTKVLDGRTKGKDLEAWMDFQDKADPQYIIVQEGSGSEGIDLFASRFLLFFSRSHSHFKFDQLKGRVVRRGQERLVNFFYLVGKKTVDEDIDYVLQNKDRRVEHILSNLKRRYN